MLFFDSTFLQVFEAFLDFRGCSFGSMGSQLAAVRPLRRGWKPRCESLKTLCPGGISGFSSSRIWMT